MLFEQAFMALPEFLVGAPYLRYDQEATLVTAFTMSVLQELNGRNIDNPISVIREEVRYVPKRNLMADAHIREDATGPLSDALRRYGTRPEAFLEAKYFRKKAAGRPTLDSTKAALDLIRDVIRLCCLPNEVVGAPPKHSRYLLHSYQDSIKDFLTKTKRKQKAKLGKPAADGKPPVPPEPVRPGFQRVWIDHLTTAGEHKFHGFRLADESTQFRGRVGEPLRTLTISGTVTNFVQTASPGPDTTFALVLSRFDKIKVERAAPTQSFSIDHSNVSETAKGDFVAIRDFVAQSLA